MAGESTRRGAAPAVPGVATVAPFLWLLISATTAAIVRVDATGTTMVTIDHDGAVSLS